MAAIENTIMTTDITIQAREIDFVTRFDRNWEALREIMGIMRPIRKTPGTKLVSYKAELQLEDGAVAEGEVIPFSHATVKPVAYDDIDILKYAKNVTIEDVAKYGAAVAVQKTDEAFLNELQGKVLDDFYAFIATGSLTDSAADFKAAVAKAIGKVKDKFKKMRKNGTQTVVWVNTMDAYDYLGAAELTIQTAFGIDYVENFMGADKLILSSEIANNKVIATPVENIDLYYIDPSDSEFAQLGLDYTVQGETNLIGFHVEGDYSRATGATYALMGMKLWAEYLDAIAVITVGGSNNSESNNSGSGDSGSGDSGSGTGA